MLTLPIPTWSNSLSLDDLILRDGLYFEKFSNTPFTGNVSGLSEGQIKNGLKFGDWYYWYESGQLYQSVTYDAGKEIGASIIYYENGRIFSKMKNKWTGDSLIQSYEKFREDGSKIDKGTLISPTGELLYSFLQDWFTSFHDNNQIKSQGKYLRGMKNGEWKYYFSNGKLKYKGKYVYGKFDGLWETFSETGVLEQSKIYKNGELVN